MDALVTGLVFLLVLSVLVLIHELGHFLVAKKLGVKVEEFGFGFPPRVFGKKYGETIYSINLLPIGGFVKLYGEDDAGMGKIGKIKDPTRAKTEVNRAFFSRPVWQRGAIVVAGVVMNFLLAVTIISYLYSVVGVGVPGKEVKVTAVIKGSPAEQSGLHAGDTIISINGKNTTTTAEVTGTTKKNLGKRMLLVVKNQQGEIKDIFVTPRLHSPSNQGAMGVAITQPIHIVKYPWYQAPLIGVRESFKESWMIVEGLEKALSDLFFKRTVPTDIAGPVGMAQITGQFIQLGYGAVLNLVALLSLNLAVLNILPIPALDGGRFFFIVFEAVTGRKVPAHVEAYAHTVGMILLLTLIALVTLHDIVRLISHQPLIPKM